MPPAIGTIGTRATPEVPGPDAAALAGVLDAASLLHHAGGRLTVLAPHPDDESLAAGGLIQRALALGVPVDVVFVTDGENNPWPQRWLERRIRIGQSGRASWARRRRAEADAALRALGAEAVSLHRLGWPDGGLTAMLLDDAQSMVVALRRLLGQLGPTVLALPDLADRHPDHGALHIAVELALRGWARDARPHCLGYVLHGRAQSGRSRRAMLALDRGELDRKRRAIEAHASQLALSRGRLMRFASGTECFVAGPDCDHRVGGRLPWRPARAMRGALALLVVDAHGGQRVRPGPHADANLHWSDGSPAAHVPRTPKSPYYVKLHCPVPSPWVFDGWGWCRVGPGMA